VLTASRIARVGAAFGAFIVGTGAVASVTTTNSPAAPRLHNAVAPIASSASNPSGGGRGLRGSVAPSRGPVAPRLDRSLGPIASNAAGPYSDDQVLVGFKRGTSASRRHSIENRVGGIRARRLGVGVFLTVPGGDVPSVIRRLKRDPAVRYAEPNYVMQASGVPNDPQFGLQWGLQNTGQSVNGTAGAPGADEHVVPAWNVTTGSSSIVIADTDTGVEYTHPDLAANIWSNPGGLESCPAGTHGFNVIAGENACDPMDDDTAYDGHGTHIAGIMGAVGNNGVGVTGINRTSSIMAVKWLDSNSSGLTSNLIAALQLVIQAKQAGQNIRVVNDSVTFVGTGYSKALSDEIDQLGANDVLFVTAAGNTAQNNDNPSTPRYPCDYDRPTEICVAASDQNDRLPSWANYGATTVDLAAPGNNIYSTLRSASYGYINGSSMAAAEVSGAAALILSAGYQSATNLKADILNNVDPIPSLTGLVRTGGRLDVCTALPGCTVPPATSRFGKTTVGANSDVFGNDRKRVNEYALSVNATVSKLTIYLQPTSTSGTQPIKGVIYADSGGAPGSLLAVSNQLTFASTNAAGWYDLTFPTPPHLAAGNYWIGVLTGSSYGVAGFRYDSVSKSRDYNANTYSSGPSNPFGPVTTIDSDQMSLYATYTVPPPASSAPANLAPPVVSGSAQVGQVLSTSNGSWTGSPTGYSYQWERCDTSGNNCVAISGATSQTDSVASADGGATLEAAVTASNSAGSATETSAPTATVPAAPSTATFGKTNVGGGVDSLAANRKRVNEYTLSVNATVSKLTIYLQPTSTSGTQAIEGVLYADSGGAPGSLLAVSNQLTFASTGAAGWYDLTFPTPPHLGAGNYWIGVLTGGSGNVAGFRYGSVSNSRDYNTNTYSSGPSDPFGPVTTIDSEQMSLYATYTQS
jgi:subtilisin family serine protease